MVVAGAAEQQFVALFGSSIKAVPAVALAGFKPPTDAFLVWLARTRSLL